VRQQAYIGNRYNELVINAQAYEEALPASLAAFFLQPARGGGEGPVRDEQIRAQHLSFLAEYRLSPSEVPLLMYNPNLEPPFTCLRC
jgi:hypothetical protein